MKILIATLEFPPFKGGVAVYTYHLARVVGCVHDVTVITHHDTTIQEHNMKYRVVSKPLLGKIIRPRWLVGLRTLRKLHAQEGYDHIITPHILPLGIIACLLKVPYTISLHGMDILMAQRNYWTRLITRYILDRAHTILVNSAYTRSQIINHESYADKIIIAYPCPDTLLSVSDEDVTNLRSRYSLSTACVLLSVNRLVARKGNDTVIRALALLKRDDLRYVIIGSGVYTNTLKALADEVGVTHQVIFLGNVDNVTRSRWYAASDLFVMPTRAEGKYDVEGFGIAYLEAAQYGLPAIAGISGGAPEAVLDGITGLLVDSQDPKAVAQALAYLADNAMIRERLGTTARKRVNAYFTWETQFASYLTHLDRSHETI